MVSQRGGSRWMMSSGTPAGAWPPKSRPASTGLMRRTIHTAMTSMHNTVTAMSTPRFSLLDATSSRTNARQTQSAPPKTADGRQRPPQNRDAAPPATPSSCRIPDKERPSSFEKCSRYRAGRARARRQRARRCKKGRGEGALPCPYVPGSCSRRPYC